MTDNGPEMSDWVDRWADQIDKATAFVNEVTKVLLYLIAGVAVVIVLVVVTRLAMSS